LSKQLKSVVDLEPILRGIRSEAFLAWRVAIIKTFGPQPPLFAVQIEKGLRDNHDNILFLRFITAAKIMIVFGLKFLSEDSLWEQSGLAEVKHFKDPDHPHAIAARRKYMATIAAEILSRSPARDDSDKEQAKLHEQGWKLSNSYKPEVAPNCVVNGARLTTGIAQAVGWDRLLLSNITQNCEGEPTKHIDPIIRDPNPMAWEFFDTYSTQFARHASVFPLFEKALKDPLTPGEVVECTLSETISILTGLPQKSLITDPLTGLTVVNLHHASIPVEGETLTDTHKLLATAGHAISPKLFKHWS
ncbi:MAG: hypothetical protein AAB540_03895, partial [Patescibacteria group bacterium]